MVSREEFEGSDLFTGSGRPQNIKCPRKDFNQISLEQGANLKSDETNSWSR
jgi:hypothetical protein